MDGPKIIKSSIEHPIKKNFICGQLEAHLDKSQGEVDFTIWHGCLGNGVDNLGRWTWQCGVLNLGRWTWQHGLDNVNFIV